MAHLDAPLPRSLVGGALAPRAHARGAPGLRLGYAGLPRQAAAETLAGSAARALALTTMLGLLGIDAFRYGGRWEGFALYSMTPPLLNLVLPLVVAAAAPTKLRPRFRGARRAVPAAAYDRIMREHHGFHGIYKLSTSVPRLAVTLVAWTFGLASLTANALALVERGFHLRPGFWISAAAVAAGFAATALAWPTPSNALVLVADDGSVYPAGVEDVAPATAEVRAA